MNHATFTLATNLKALVRRTSLAFVRHGNTLPKEECGGLDFQRVLSPKGKEQCRRARATWLPVLEAKGVTPIAVTSAAPRCHETLDEILGEVRPKISEEMLYDSMLQPQGSELFEKCGYAPLQTYLDEGGVEFLGDYARRFLVRLDAMTSNGEIPKLAPTLLICGHSIYTNAIVWEAAELLDVPSDLALETYLGETDGFLLTDKKITMLSSLSS